VFPREQLHVVVSEELRAQPANAYARVLAFLGLPRHTLRSFPPIFERHYPPMAGPTRTRLAAGFADANGRLERLLGRSLDWTS
jgi:hypothetical protein